MVASSDFTITWGPSQGAESYSIQLVTKPDCSQDPAAALETSSLSANFTGIIDGIYFLCVLAKSANAETVPAANNSFQLTVDTIAPKLTGLTAGLITASSVYLNWEKTKAPLEQIKKYRVFYSDTSTLITIPEVLEHGTELAIKDDLALSATIGGIDLNVIAFEI